jgi:hypothetical protein
MPFDDIRVAAPYFHRQLGSISGSERS